MVHCTHTNIRILGLLCLWTCACHSSSAKVETSSSDKPPQIKVADGLGRPVQLQRSASRIASLSPGFTEILFEIGCGDQIVLRDTWSDYPPQVLELPAVDGVSPSVLNIAGYNPDLVLMYFSDDRHVAGFDKLKIQSAVFDAKTYQQVTEEVETLGVLCGQKEAADRLSRQMRHTRETVRSAAAHKDAVSVYVEIDGTEPSRPWTAGPGSFIHELLEIAGARNALENVNIPYAQVNVEAVIRSNPDYILLAGTDANNPAETIAEFSRRPGVSVMNAVKQSRIISTIDKDMLTRVGPRLSTALVQLFDELHQSDVSNR